MLDRLLLVDASNLIRQEGMLKELREVTARIEKLSQTEHDLISEVHPEVSEIKEHVEDVREKFLQPKTTEGRVDPYLLK